MINKNFLGSIILSGYLLSSLLSWMGYIPFNTVYAAKENQLTPLIAILVEKDLYPSVAGDLQWYGASYLPQQNPGAESIIFQIDTQKYDAVTISKMLENVYFDGLEGEGSRLIGIVLVGDIPLPVINLNGYVFPSIYPYVDFWEQKYVYDPLSSYFVSNEGQLGQAEVWHGMINFKDSTASYTDFFGKLKKYGQDPESYVNKAIWYDDFIALKHSILDPKLVGYVNQQAFLEDLMYNRFHSALLGYLKGEELGKNSDLLESLIKDLRAMGYNEEADEMEKGLKDLGELGEEKTPTLFLKEHIDNFIADYQDILATDLITTQRDNIMASDRWQEYDSHIDKLSIQDRSFAGGADVMGLIMNLNEVLEDYIDEKVEQENYPMKIVLPTSFSKDQYTKIKRLGISLGYAKTLDDTYRFFYFGKDAQIAMSPLDLSIFRGTYRNFLTIHGAYSAITSDPINPAKDAADPTDLSRKGVGASYDLFSTQVEANRGYNPMNTMEEYELYQTEKTYKKENIVRKCTKRVFSPIIPASLPITPCKERSVSYKGKCNPSSDNEKDQKDCETFEEFSHRIRGGASPLNLDWDLLSQGIYKLKNYDYKSAWKWIYDIDGSQAIKSPEVEATSYLAKDKYLSPTLIKTVDDEKIDAYQYPIYHDLKDEIDYFKVIKEEGVVFFPQGKGNFKLLKPRKSKTEIEYRYTYKVADSLIKHDSTTSEQVNGYTGLKYSESSESRPYYQQMSEILQESENNSGQIMSGIDTASQVLSGLLLIQEEIKNQTWIGTGVLEDIENVNEDLLVLFEKLDDAIFLLAQDPGAGIEDVLKLFESTTLKKDKVQIGPFGISAIPFFSEWYDDILGIFSGNIERMEALYLEIPKLIQEVDKVLTRYNAIKNYVNEKIADLTALLESEDEELDISGITEELAYRNTVLENMEKLQNNISQLSGNDSVMINLRCAVSGSAKVCPSSEEGVLEISDKVKSLIDAKSKFITTLISEKGNPEIVYSGMSMTTPDRPIDSPRYLSFQGIGASEVKLIYPNLFKIEVYNGDGELKEPKDIALAIEEYLENIFKIYNESLEAQKAAAPALLQDIAYQKLALVDLLATPTLSPTVRSYELFDIGEVKAIFGGEEMINTLAWKIYFQNVSNLERKISDTILQDLDDIRRNFDINEKIEKTIDYFVAEGMDVFFKEENTLPEMVIPTYEKGGYEVAFFNTDGNDYIKTNIMDYLDSEDLLLARDVKNTRDPLDSVTETHEETDSCGFNYNEALLVFDIETMTSPWVEGLKCWWADIQKKPFELTLSWNNANILAPGLDDSLFFSGAKNYIKDRAENDWKDFATKGKDYLDDLKIFPNIFNFPKSENNENNNSKINEIFEYTQIGFENQKISLESGTGKILFGSSKDLGNITLRVTTTGDNCLSIGGKNSCNGPISLNVNPFKKEELGIKLMKNTAGIIYVIIEFCESGTCSARTHMIPVAPGKPHSFSLLFPYKDILAGIYTPIDLEVKDRFGNALSRDIEFYTIAVDQGYLFLGGEEKSEFQINDFQNANLGYRIPYGANGVVEFKITDHYGTGMHGAAPIIQTMKVVNGKLEMIESTDIEQKTEPLILGSGPGAKLNPLVAKKIDIKYIDEGGSPIPVDIKVLMNSEEAILDPYALKEKVYENGVEESLKKIKRLDLKSGIGSFWIVAGKKTGIETIKALIPGLPEKQLKVLVFGENILVEEPEEGKEKFFLNNAINSGLNVMYLNLFGSDRGNQWSYLSENKKFSEDVIGKSSRTLSVTTNLVIPNKVMKSSVVVDSNGLVSNNNNLVLNTHVDKSGIFIDFDNYATLKIPNFNPQINIFLGEKSEEEVKKIIVTNNEKSLLIYSPVIEMRYQDAKLLDKNNEIVWNQKEGSDLRITNEYLEGHNVWGLFHKGEKIASVVLLNIEMDADTAIKTLINDTEYDITKLFDSGSSHQQKSIALFSKTETLDQVFENYPSIENSHYPEEYLGFRGNFKNITLFGGGQSVGEATIPFGSEFLINIGDPGLRRIDTNPNIEKKERAKKVPVIEGDLGGDAEEETITSLYHGGLGQVIYNSPTKDIFKVQDIDYNADGLRDLIIMYNDGTVDLLKQYVNGEFVDMKTLLLTSEGVDKIFAGDVDGNGYEDIIIKNTKNQMRVYTNTAGEFDVDGYPVCLNVTRESIEDEMSLRGVQQIFMEDMDKDGAIDIIVVDRLGFVKVFYGGKDAYISKEKNKCDKGWKSRQIEVLVDQIKVVKKSAFINDTTDVMEEVDVSNSEFDPTELLSPPPLQPILSPGFGTKEEDIEDTIERLEKVLDLEEAGRDMVEVDAPIQANNVPNPLFPDRIFIEDVHAPNFKPEFVLQIEKDDYLDITIVSEDGCDKVKKTYFNNGGGARSFSKDTADLQYLAYLETVGRETANVEANEELNKQMGESQKEQNPDSIPFLDQIKEVFRNVKIIAKDSKVLDGLKIADLFSEEIGKYEKEIQDIADGLCHGFVFGKKYDACEGLPIPFNQAFLAPGEYHVMGCFPLPPLTNILGKGFPIFSIPTTGPLNVAGVPIPPFWPINFNGAGGIFGGNTSQFRIYVAPTLTAQVGVALCFGPYGVASKIKGFAGEIAGNCIVTSFPLPCKNNEEEEEIEDPDNIAYTTWAADYGNTKTCNASNYDFDEILIPDDEPFPLNPDEKLKEAMATFIPNPNSTRGTSLGNSDKQGVEITIDGVKILGGSTTPNKILAGLERGIQQKIMGWLDKQVEYIKHNLLRFSLTIKLPDLGGMTQSFSQINSALDNFMLDTDSSKWLSPTNTIKSYSESIKNAGTDLGEGASNAWDEILTPFRKTQSSGKDGIKTLLSEKDFSAEKIDQIANPYQQESAFDTLKRALNATDLVSVSTKNINIRVPWIYPEEIEAYANYLRIWMETNASILKDWGALIESTISSCNVDRTQRSEEENAKCLAVQKAQQKYLQLINDFDKLNEQIFKNIEVLEKYKRFPLEIYEWLHVSERYLSEISGIISNTFGYLNYWFSLFASRISQWSDALVTIISVIKTYQVLIDFSVNRNQKCGKCRVDTYDQYSCKFDALLPDLPLLEIPNIKIPSLILDFSHINLGMDLVLPRFNFIPENIHLPMLANLPTPPAVLLGIDFKLPDIPILPDPPTLPELPSFIPTVNLSIPNLPPPPEIPEFPNKLSKMIQILQKIAKIYCIIKSGVGMVAEPAVKSRIEQMTQRNYLVPWVDSLDMTRLFRPTILQGVDYAIDSYVDIEYNFEGIYSLLNNMANDLNNWTYKNITNPINTTSASLQESVNNGIQGTQNFVDQGNVNLNLELDLTYEKGLTKDKILTQLREAVTLLESNSEKQKLDELVQLAKIDSSITLNKENFSQTESTIQTKIKEQQYNISSISALIKEDYPRFLASIEQQNQKQQTLQLSFSGNLFETSPQLNNVLANNANNPYSILLESKENRLNQSLEEIRNDKSLFASERAVYYEKVFAMKKALTNYKSIVVREYAGQEVLTSKDGNVQKPLLAQIIGNPAIIETASTDYSNHIKGIIIDRINIINSEYNAEKFLGYYQVDLNRDGDLDFIAWDARNVYYKIAGDAQKKGQAAALSVITPNLDQIQKDKDKYTTTQKSLFGSKEKVKTMDESWEVKNFKIIGQTFDSLSFSRDNSLIENNSGYLVRLTENIAKNYEKTEKDPKYVLILPYDTSIEGKNLIIEEKKKSIEAMLGSAIHEIKYFNPSHPLAKASLVEVPRKWQYLQIAALASDGDDYKVRSPWSNQIVAGRQLIADNQPPIPSVSLLRKKVPETVAEGTYLRGYVGTYYDLIIDREDNVEVKKAAIIKDTKLLVEVDINKQRGTISLNDLFYTQKTNEKYLIWAIDAEGNQVMDTVNLQIITPKIQITDIQQYSGWKEGLNSPLKITSEWDMDIDKGHVTIQRLRNGIISDIEGINNGSSTTTSAISIGQTTLDRQWVDYGNMIGMYDQNNNLLIQLDPDSGELIILPEYLDQVELEVDFSNGYPQLKVLDIKTRKVLFDIFLQAEELKNILLKKGELVALEGRSYGIYDGGYAYLLNNTPLLYISKTGHIGTLDRSLRGKYSYNREKGETMITILENAFGEELLQVVFTVKSYSKK